ncbi:MAG: heme exporter protein CcmB [Actinobacteria bacterium]|nr:heme exporter protein CcmB [Actinomycetota bacterium]
MSTTAPSAGSPFRQALELCRAELRVEARAGEVLWVITPFGAVALLLMPMAVGTDRPLLGQLGVGLYWIVVLLFGVLVTLRQSASDTPEQVAMLRLCGVPPAARLLGRAAATTVALLVFELLLAPVVEALYQPYQIGWVWAVPVLPLVAAGLGALGTLAGAVAAGLPGHGTLAALLVCPVAVPLLLGATEVFQAEGYGRPGWAWLLLLVTVDLIGWLALSLSAAELEEGR